MRPRQAWIIPAVLALALLAANPVQVKGKVPASAVAMYVHGWHHQEQPPEGGDVVHNLIGFLIYLSGYEPEDLFDGEKAFFTFKTEGFDLQVFATPGFPVVVEPFEIKVYYNDPPSGIYDPENPSFSCDPDNFLGQHIATFRTTPARILMGEGIIFSAELTDSAAFSFQGETFNFQSLFPGLTFSLSYTTLSVSACGPYIGITELGGSAWAVGHPLPNLGGP